MPRKLNSNTIKPVITYVKTSVNSGYYKYYHFTLDTYQGKNSFQGGTAYDLSDCYASTQYNNDGTVKALGKPYDEFAMNLETGDIIKLDTKEIVSTVKL